MLTLRTQKAIALMYDLTLREEDSVHTRYGTTPQEVEELLACLEKKGLIIHTQEGEGDGAERNCNRYGYRPARPFSQISLLDILEALDEHLNCNCPTTEEFYSHFIRVAQKLGVVNRMTRIYLEEIKLTEF